MPTALDQDIIAIASARRALHKGHSSQRLLGNQDDEDIIGVAGEQALGLLLGQLIDETPRQTGDAGIDFTVGEFTLNVHCHKIPRRLLATPKELRYATHIYVLAQFFGQVRIGRQPNEQRHAYLEGAIGPRAYLCGWATREELLAAPVETMRGNPNNPPSHAIHDYDLRPISSLRGYLGLD